MSEFVCYYCQNAIAAATNNCPQCGQPQVLRERYRLKRLLGQGGFGVVYEAVDADLNRHYAIKLIIATSGAIREQVAIEAQILAQHARRLPFMPEIYDIWTESNRIALVMEYIDGATLGSLIEQHGAWAPNVAGRFLHTILSNLDSLHNVGIIHRDIKPDNIKRTADGRYVLLDFGIAKRSLSTETGAKAFSLYYASPEQAQGKATDARSDLYSLGATTYHMLTGHPPAPGEARQVMNAELQPPTHFAPKTPPVLSNLVMQMLELDPDKRPASAKAAMKILVAPPTVNLRSDQAAASPPASPAVAHVRVAAPSSAGMPTQAITPAPARAVAPPTAPVAPSASRSRGALWVIAAIMLAVLGGGLIWFTQRDPTLGIASTSTPAAGQPTTIPVVVAAATQTAEPPIPTSPAPPPTITPAATATSQPPIEPTPAPIIEPTIEVPAATAAPTDIPAPTAVPLSADLQEVVNLVNDQRALQGLVRLTVNPQLISAAQAHSDDMASNNFFSNTGSDGSSVQTRINRAGYIASLSIENIAAGYATPLEVVSSWMNDDGQRANLLNPDVRDVGVGYAANPAAQYGRYWTIVYTKP